MSSDGSGGARPSDATRDWSGHVIVCGLHGLGVRTVELLRQAQVPVVLVDDMPEPRLVPLVESWGIPVLTGSARLPETLWAAGLAGALAVVAVESDELSGLETALLVRDLRPDVRTVVRLSNTAVGRAVTGLTGPGSALSVATLSAPAIVEACLQSPVHALDVPGAELLAATVTADGAGPLRHRYGALAPIAVEPADGGAVVVCPGRDHPVSAGDRVTLVGSPDDLLEAGVDIGSHPRASRHVNSHPRAAMRVLHVVRSLAAEADTALRAALLALAVLVVTSTVVLALTYRNPTRGGGHTHLSSLDAFYFTLETVATVGFGDFSFTGQGLGVRIFGTALIILGVACITTVFALLTDLLVSRRLTHSLGRHQARRMRGHVVLIGLGSVGIGVAEALLAAGRPVVVIDRDEDNRYLGQARALGLPVIIGDATLLSTLQAAALDTAHAVAVLTSDDLTNIESGLAIRDALGDRWPEVPVVLRVFDRSLARTLGRSFGFRQAASTADIAAPWFVGAALGLDVLGTLSLNRLPLLLGRLTVAAGGGLDGLAMGELSERTRVIALARAGGITALEHPPRRDTRFAAGDQAYVIGPYDEIVRLLRRDQHLLGRL